MSTNAEKLLKNAGVNTEVEVVNTETTENPTYQAKRELAYLNTERKLGELKGDISNPFSSIATKINIPDNVEKQSASNIFSELGIDPDRGKYQQGLRGTERDQLLLKKAREGKVPEYLKNLHPVKVKTEDGGEATVYITKTRITVGTDNDYLVVPCNDQMSKDLPKALGLERASAKVMRAAYEQGKQVNMYGEVQNKNDTRYMAGNGFTLAHSRRLREQLNNQPPDTLIVGDGKVVLPSKKPGKLRIWGGLDINGNPIQPDQHPHAAIHTDYSQGVYGVSGTVLYTSPSGETKQMSYAEAKSNGYV